MKKTMASSRVITSGADGWAIIPPNLNRDAFMAGPQVSGPIRIQYGPPSSVGYGLYVYYPQAPMIFSSNELGTCVKDQWLISDANGNAGVAFCLIEILEAP